MAHNVTHGIDTRTGQATVVKNGIDAGSGFGKINIRDASDVILATIVLPKPSTSQSGAVLTALGVPLAFTGTANGTATKADIVDSDDTKIVAGTCGMTDCDFTIDNDSITIGQTGSLTGLTYTAPV